MLDPHLRALDWGKLSAQAYKFAFFRCRQEEMAQDLAQEAIRRMISSESMPWDPAREPNAARHLMSIVNSLLANERTSARARRTGSFESGTKKDAKAVAKKSDPSALSEEAVAKRQLAERGVARLRERLADHPLALAVLERKREGDETPSEICAALGKPYDAVVLAWRKVQREAAAVRAELEREHDGAEPRADEAPAPRAEEVA